MRRAHADSATTLVVMAVLLIPMGVFFLVRGLVKLIIALCMACKSRRNAREERAGDE